MKKYGITLFLTLILLLGLVVPAVSAQVPEAALAAAQEQSPELLDAAAVAKGIDVSHHQGAINWDAVAGQIDFAVIRCGFGGNLTAQDDRQWSANVAACERLGIPYGVYLYSYAETDDEASDEAQHVLRLLQGHTPQLPVYLDLEDSVISSNCSAADILRHTTIFLQYDPGGRLSGRRVCQPELVDNAPDGRSLRSVGALDRRLGRSDQL